MTGTQKDLVRAVEQGVVLLDSEEATFATSVSQPFFLYKVDEDHCDCKGFEFRGHCKHRALFVARQIDEGLAYFGL